MPTFLRKGPALPAVDQCGVVTGLPMGLAKFVPMAYVRTKICEASLPFRAGLPGKEDGHFCTAPLDPALPGEAYGEQAGQRRLGNSRK